VIGTFYLPPLSVIHRGDFARRKRWIEGQGGCFGKCQEEGGSAYNRYTGFEQCSRDGISHSFIFFPSPLFSVIMADPSDFDEENDGVALETPWIPIFEVPRGRGGNVRNQDWTKWNSNTEESSRHAQPIPFSDDSLGRCFVTVP
jgi:hypothetical protein